MARLDPQVLAHLEWLGFVQPTGLVVSAPALVRAGAILDRRDVEGQRLLRASVGDVDAAPDEGDAPVIGDFVAFAKNVLGWSFSPKGYVGMEGTPIPPELEVNISDHGEALRPDFAVREREPSDDALPWQLLVKTIETGQRLDAVTRDGGQLEASAHGRMERMLRETGVSAGLLCNGTTLRLISAPRGESSGWLDFHMDAMVQNAGRPISTALRLLLGEPRLLLLPRKQRLAALLDDSRKFQNEVSEKLAEQVLHGLYEFLRGFQAAHDASGGELLRHPLGEHPDEVYRALLTVILRLVFLLYAEEREMLPTGDATFARYYSVAGLYERLRSQAAQFPDTMDQRYGGWAQLLVLFRMVHDGAEAGSVVLPPRHGVLFDPDRFPFLEGRSGLGSRQLHERIEPPLVPDGTVYRALDKLLVLDGERISYRALDVEQIGSVYETMMGFRLETAIGRSLAVKPAKKRGAPATIDLEALLAQEASKRDKWLRDRTDRKLPAKVATAVKGATSLADMHAALAPVTDIAATPDLVPQGAMVLQPSEERRRSGSHYTPRTLTEPIVRTTLAPVLHRLRGDEDRTPQPDEILELKVCDPAMGSGAFLVEVCRQLGDALIEAWSAHGGRPDVPPDEDEVVFARRLVAQRCLYGVDRNPVAVDLAKMSLWLATLAREHALTFVDHALRYGDSLVGLNRRQIEAFHWDETAPRLAPVRIAEHLERVTELRAQIRSAGEEISDWSLRDMWDEAQAELEEVRLFGDLAVLAHFSGSTASEREAKRFEFAAAVGDGVPTSRRALVQQARDAERPLVPFHWSVEFPEVFARETPGFDVIVGNPPFAGKNTLTSANPPGYPEWLKWIHAGTHGNADLVAHFFRRAFVLLRDRASCGLIATNTIGQGDTRGTGLRWICSHGGTIFSARRRVKWPGGSAAVTVSVVHIEKGKSDSRASLDGREVDSISAFLFHRGGHDDPIRLRANAGNSFAGFYTLGKAFTFDDSVADANSTALMRELLVDPKNQQIVQRYMGGEEINEHPRQSPHRWVIDFGAMPLDAAEQWPELLEILRTRVRPGRLQLNRKALRERWWQFAEVRPGLRAASARVPRVLATSSVSKHRAFVFVPSDIRLSHNVTVITLETYRAFGVLQSRVHEIWASFFSSSLEDRSGYRPSDCFETFPFPEGWESDQSIEEVARAYYELRSDVMVASDEGLTKIYNRFNDPDERSPEILKLRALHGEMDCSVLAAYGWSDVVTESDFFLDFEVEDDDEPTQRKKPWRYRWPDDIKDEVLGRLIELNGERAAEEDRVGGAAPPQVGKRRAAARPEADQAAESLF